VEFFNSEFYQRCSPQACNPYAGKDRNWRFWMPLLMLFSGARPNEIAQLATADLRKTDNGTLYIDLETQAAGTTKTLKTMSSRRRIPVHSELIKIGIVQFVNERQAADGTNAKLFPSLKPDRYGNLAWYPSKRFNEKFLPESIALTPDQTFYSFRHCPSSEHLALMAA
jgi:integrase